MEMDNLTNSECCFCLISVARNVTSTPLLTRSQHCSFSDGSRTRQMFVYANNSYTFSSHKLNTRIRTFKVRGRFRQHLYCSEYTEGFARLEFSRTRTSTSTQSTRYELRTAHVRGEMKHEFRTVQVRGEVKPGLHTVCVRKPSDFALLRVRGPKDQFARFGVRGHKLVLGRVYQAGSVRQPAIRNTTPMENPARHDT